MARITLISITDKPSHNRERRPALTVLRFVGNRYGDDTDHLVQRDVFGVVFEQIRSNRGEDGFRWSTGGFRQRSHEFNDFGDTADCIGLHEHPEP